MIFVVMEFMKYSLRDKRCVNRVGASVLSSLLIGMLTPRSVF